MLARQWENSSGHLLVTCQCDNTVVFPKIQRGHVPPIPTVNIPEKGGVAYQNDIFGTQLSFVKIMHLMFAKIRETKSPRIGCRKFSVTMKEI